MKVRVVTTAQAVVQEEWTIEAPNVSAARAWFDGIEEPGVRVLSVENIDVSDEHDRVVNDAAEVRS